MATWNPPVHGEVGQIPQRGELVGERERNGKGSTRPCRIGSTPTHAHPNEQSNQAGDRQPEGPGQPQAVPSHTHPQNRWSRTVCISRLRRGKQPYRLYYTPMAPPSNSPTGCPTAQCIHQRPWRGHLGNQRPPWEPEKGGAAHAMPCI